MRPLLWAAVAVGVTALAFGLTGTSQARVKCRDDVRGVLSADMDLTDVTVTPDGWVLYFPRRERSRQVEVWASCTVRP